MKRLTGCLVFIVAFYTTMFAQAQNDPSEIKGGLHVGAGMGFNAGYGTAAFQMGLGASHNRLFAFATRTYPGNTQEQPTITQGKVGYVLGSNGPKMIPYVGITRVVMDYKLRFSQSMELYPERYIEYRYTSFMYGVEFSYPIAPFSRIFFDLSFTNDRRQDLSKRIPDRAGPHVMGIFGVKALLFKNVEDCYPGAKKVQY